MCRAFRRPVTGTSRSNLGGRGCDVRDTKAIPLSTPVHGRQGTHGERYSLDLKIELFYRMNFAGRTTTRSAKFGFSRMAGWPAGRIIPTQNSAWEMRKSCIVYTRKRSGPRTEP